MRLPGGANALRRGVCPGTVTSDVGHEARKRSPPSAEKLRPRENADERCVARAGGRRARAVAVASSMWGRSTEKLSLRLMWSL